jgi:hypothetical protein
VTATGDTTLAARRDLLLQAYAAYNNQDVDVLLQLVSDDVCGPPPPRRGQANQPRNVLPGASGATV